MKFQRNYLITISMVFFLPMLLLYGCVNNSIVDYMLEKSSTAPTKTVVGEFNAVMLANKILHRTRSLNTVNIQYVIAQSKRTRVDNELNDTLAYIINYADSKGFAVIANDRRVYPILAFSEEGELSTDNKIVKQNFLDLIEPYMQHAIAKAPPVNDDPIIGNWQISGDSVIKLKMGQQSPYNMIVRNKCAGPYVGCGPLTAAMLGCYAVDSLYYNGYFYNFKNITNRIIIGPTIDYDYDYDRIIRSSYSMDDNTRTWPDTYNGSIAAINQLLYDLGKDTHSDYQTDGTSTRSDSVRFVLDSIGFQVSKIYDSYDESRIVSMLQRSWLLYIEGTNPGNDKTESSTKIIYGHAWAIDGLKIVLLVDKNQYFMHCNWGWYGEGNGFYSGDVFNIDSIGKSYKPNKYFGVKIKTS